MQQVQANDINLNDTTFDIDAVINDSNEIHRIITRKKLKNKYKPLFSNDKGKRITKGPDPNFPVKRLNHLGNTKTTNGNLSPSEQSVDKEIETATVRDADKFVKPPDIYNLKKLQLNKQQKIIKRNDPNMTVKFFQNPPQACSTPILNEAENKNTNILKKLSIVLKDIRNIQSINPSKVQPTDDNYDQLRINNSKINYSNNDTVKQFEMNKQNLSNLKQLHTKSQIKNITTYNRTMQLEFPHANQNYDGIFVNEPIQNRILDNVNRTNRSDKDIESETVVPPENLSHLAIEQLSNCDLIEKQSNTFDGDLQVEENNELQHDSINKPKSKTVPKENSSDSEIELDNVIPPKNNSRKSDMQNAQKKDTSDIQEKSRSSINKRKSKTVPGENSSDCEIELDNVIQPKNNSRKSDMQITQKIDKSDIIQEKSASSINKRKSKTVLEQNSADSKNTQKIDKSDIILEKSHALINEHNSKSISEENFSNSEIEFDNVIQPKNNLRKSDNTQKIDKSDIILEKSRSINKRKSKTVPEQYSSDSEIELDNVIPPKNNSRKSDMQNTQKKDTSDIQEKSRSSINKRKSKTVPGENSSDSEIELDNVIQPKNNSRKSDMQNTQKIDKSDIIQEKSRSSINKRKSKTVPGENSSDSEIELDNVIQPKNNSRKSDMQNTQKIDKSDIIQEKSRSINKLKSKTVPEENSSDSEIELDNVIQPKNNPRKSDRENTQKIDKSDIILEKSRSINKRKSKTVPEQYSSDSEIELENVTQLKNTSKKPNVQNIPAKNTPAIILEKPSSSINKRKSKSVLEENSADSEVENENLNQLQNLSKISKPQYKLIPHKNQFIQNKSHSSNKKSKSKIVQDQNNSLDSEIEVQSINLANDYLPEGSKAQYLSKMHNLKSKSIRRTHNEIHLNTGIKFHHQERQRQHLLNIEYKKQIHKNKYSKHMSRLERLLSNSSDSSSDSADTQYNKKYKLTDNRNVAHNYYQHSIQYKNKNNKMKRKYYHGTKSDIDSEQEIRYHKKPKRYTQIIHYVNSGASINNRNNQRISQKPNRKRSKIRHRNYNSIRSSDSETSINRSNGKKKCVQPLNRIQSHYKHNQFNSSSSDLESNCEKITNQKFTQKSPPPQKDDLVNAQKNVPQDYQSNGGVVQSEDETEKCESPVLISNRSTQIDNRNLIITDKNLSYKPYKIVNNVNKNKTNELQKSHREPVEEERSNENIVESLNQTNILSKEDQENYTQKDSDKNKKHRTTDNAPLTDGNIPISSATAINFERLSQCANESTIIELSPKSSQVQKNHITAVIELGKENSIKNSNFKLPKTFPKLRARKNIEHMEYIKHFEDSIRSQCNQTKDINNSARRILYNKQMDEDVNTQNEPSSVNINSEQNEAIETIINKPLPNSSGESVILDPVAEKSTKQEENEKHNKFKNVKQRKDSLNTFTAMAVQLYAYNPLKEREVIDGCRRSSRIRRLPVERKIFTEPEIKNLISDRIGDLENKKFDSLRTKMKVKQPKSINTDSNNEENNKTDDQSQPQPQIYKPPAEPSCNWIDSIFTNQEKSTSQTRDIISHKLKDNNDQSILQTFTTNNLEYVHKNVDYAFYNKRTGYLRLEPFTKKDAVVTKHRINLLVLSGSVNVIVKNIDNAVTATEGIWFSISKGTVYEIRNDSNKYSIIHFCKEL